MNVTCATKAEIDIINRLQRQILPLDTLAATSLGWWWVARDSAGLPVGFAGLHPSKRWGDAAYLCRAGVLVRARGHGLQKRLIAVREQKARRLGMRWLITDTNGNPASANNLIACGFRMYLPAHPWADIGACYWRKALA